ncbi:Putative DhaL domain-containing protein [Septoria linicola]|uniref:DhaL domain-containing protein n=1 Tax=Septoria linicola TaxID=215465 RepID=A0A9Q9EK01_9PEZI|nr:Putative DhaL domain-containing protein [Septoria linicola]
MSVVVEQTIPFSSTALDLGNTARWNTLFPLIRPSVKTVQTQKGQNIVVDTAKADGKHVHIIAVGTSGNFSSKLLDDKHVTAIVTEEKGAGILHATDLPHTLQSAGIQVLHGVVVVRAGKQRKFDAHQPYVLEIETNGGLEQDHVLQLLGTATETTRSNPHHISDLLKAFVQDASTAHSKFHTEKSEGNPAILHVDGTKGYARAKHAVERDLQHVLKAHSSVSKDDVVYSVHYSDVNGLSRLENYIIAGEISNYLDSQNIQYTLSHSTVLDHNEQARGFSVSICPLPSYFLAAKQKPIPHQSTGPTSDTAALKKALSPSSSKITFEDAKVRSRIVAGCEAVIKEESTITEYDTIVGDGDCGYTLRDGAKQVMSFIANKDLSRLPETVAELVSELEVNMGGTSGALYCIFLTALASSLASADSVPKALQKALGELCKYTNARVGDRTMMDTLIPFIETLANGGGDVTRALEEAEKGVEGTKTMEAKLGRSTYLDEAATRGVPDPGAYGLLVLLRGMTGS